MWQATTVFLVKEKRGGRHIILCRICGMSFALLLLGHLYICQDCSTLLNLMVNICTVLTVSVQRGWNATQVAAYCGHLSLARELVDTYHGVVHQKAEVM